MSEGPWPACQGHQAGKWPRCESSVSLLSKGSQDGLCSPHSEYLVVKVIQQGNFGIIVITPGGHMDEPFR